MKNKIIAGILSGVLCLTSMGIIGVSAASSQDIHFFLDKIANTQDAAKKELGVAILNAYTNTDTPDISGLKSFIRATATSDDISKLEENGYTLDQALSSLDILEKMKKEDIQDLISAVKAGNTNDMRNILNEYLNPKTPETPAAGGGGGGGSAVPVPSPVVETPALAKPEHLAAQGLIAVKFRDIEKHWAKADIEFLAERGIIKGQSEASFNPNGNITRAEFTALIVKLFDLKVKDIQADINFVDVKTGDWYYEIIKIGRQHGLTQGISADQFAPNQEITREQMVTILMNALASIEQVSNNTGSAGINKFEDRLDVSQWAVESISKAVNLGIIKGKKDNLFIPKGLATRAEAAAMMRKVFEMIYK